jgi:2-dehydropantoate 2-reductase
LAGDFIIPVNATADPSDTGPVDFVLFCVKAYDNAVASEQIRPLIGAETIVLSVQNGIDNEVQIGKVVGLNTLWWCRIRIRRPLSPGVITQTAGPER